MVPVASWVSVWSILMPTSFPFSGFPSVMWVVSIFSVTVFPIFIPLVIRIGAGIGIDLINFVSWFPHINNIKLVKSAFKHNFLVKLHFILKYENNLGNMR